MTNQEPDAAGKAVGYILGFLIIGGAIAMLIASFYVSPEAQTDSGGSLQMFLRYSGGIILGLGVMGLPIGIILHQENRKKAARLRELKASAVPGVLRIVSFEQLYANEDSVELSLDVEITVPSRQPYRMALKQWIPTAYVGRLRPDERLPVRVPASEPGTLFIDWGGKAEPGV
ncbi:hypothetical protein [Hyalangium rubrum]|uniref:Uncharacterized protein n=1 Tax=Hyalangium rubrum TaxID=3103134 RepID=A0ABU5H195_9BACT|nr:hypothetical protein [Hyalangium sp. s54d21]MDY7227175.1 hypothetical protein [Hyalangium sp. s54d21]